MDQFTVAELDRIMWYLDDALRYCEYDSFTRSRLNFLIRKVETEFVRAQERANEEV